MDKLAAIRVDRFLKQAVVLVLLFFGSSVAAEIHIQKTPGDGLQPRLSVDSNGDIHLLYFKKRLSAPSAREGNLYYRQYMPLEKRFSLPVKVSSKAYDLQTYAIARASMAVGGDGRIHVVWYLPRANQYHYTRSNIQRTEFEPQRSMADQYAEGLDAGADIAARGSKVAIVWAAGDLSREYERTVYSRLSTDFGASFSEEFRLGDPDLGACACCSLAMDYVDESELNVAYRSAIDGVGRHMQILSLQVNEGEPKKASYGAVSPLQEWELSACPLSTNDIAVGQADDQWLVFETAARIIQLKLDEQSTATSVADPFSETRQKNPAVAVNSKGDRLIVWAEAISHTKGGRLNMRLFKKGGTLEGARFTEAVAIPNFSFPAAAELPNGDFLVLY